MIKIITGLGLFSHPFAPEGQFSAATVEKTPFFGTTNAQITVDHLATPVLGNMNRPGMVDRVYSSSPNRIMAAVPSQALPAPLHADPNTVGPLVPSFVSVAPQVSPDVLSQPSGPASYETLYHDFDIDCYPTYNFWVTDEETNDSDDVGDRKLDDVPRYIRIVWNPAPDLAALYRTAARPSGKRNGGQPAMLGSESRRKSSFTSKGITFAPRHLNDFALVKRSLANGFVSPGTVHSVVEVSRESPTSGPITSVEPYDNIDEDTFLHHPDMEGISIEELRANVESVTNGTVYSGQLTAQELSDSVSEDKLLFSGKFSVDRPATNGGFMYIRGVHSAGPPLGFKTRISTSMEDQSVPADPVLQVVQKVVASQPALPDPPETQARVNFVYSSLGGLLDPSKVGSMRNPVHAESAAALAQFLPNLEVMNAAGMQNVSRQIDIPNFPSPPNLPHIEYVGYVLEKYEQLSTGAFSLKETVDLPRRDLSEYVDSKIKYSSVYRYRIRSILRWTRPNYQGVQGVDPNPAGGQLGQSRSFTPYRSSYFHSEWSKTWAHGMVIDLQPPNPPDELRVHPDSSRRRVVVTFKLPLDTLRDIYSMRLFRKVQDQDGRDLTGWAQVGTDWGPENVMYVDTDVDFYQDRQVRYVYTAQTITRHGEYSCLSDQLSVRLNKSYATYGEYPINFVSQAGVRLEHFGSFSTSPYRRALTEVIVQNGVPFFFAGRETNGGTAQTGNQYFVRIESLDTGETADYPVQLVYDNLPDRVDRHGSATFVEGQARKARVTKNLPARRNWPADGPLPRTASSAKNTSNTRGFSPSGVGQ